MAARLLLVRHGQSTWNADGRWQGQADPPLTPLGVEQAELAAHALEPIDAVWSSDLQRAARTAEIIAHHHGLTPRVEPGLRERDAGEWTGLTRVEIEAAWPGMLTRRARPPGFETDQSLLGRLVPLLQKIGVEHDGQVVVTVTHGGIVRALERHLDVDGNAGFLPNLGGRWLEVDRERVVPGAAAMLLDASHTTTPRQL